MEWIEQSQQKATAAFQLDRLKAIYGTTRNYVVGIEAAEVLSEYFPVFSVTEIRECLQWEPVRRAIALMGWAARKDDPYEALKGWAVDERAGYYRSRKSRPSEARGDEGDAYYDHLARKMAESFRNRGMDLTLSEVEDLTVEFYAPAMRAEANVMLRGEAGAGADEEVA